ncbi:hypothetical protein HFTV1-gp38 [Haloferax tailed virus 1]|uniref:Uncharacterized protein n=1 Tax=Haloferax tailed virus 1 TaxID=2507575 RepID=A0A410N6S4_HFTV1|nr:hypothetical protein M1M17_gp38 [Haloferax tailed virus 1]QAS68871.1 hypothetical protein HFTV1-gp38 [Haloferax tailed virus 1]
MNAIRVIAGISATLFKVIAGFTGIIAVYYYAICLLGMGSPFELYAAFLWTILTMLFGSVFLVSAFLRGGD